MVIDCHIHIIVPEIERAAAPDDTWRPLVEWENGRQFCTFGGKRINSMLRDAVQIDRIMEEQTAAGVDRIVLTPWSSLLGYELPLEDGLCINQIQNDALAALVAADPDRIAALGTVPLQNSDAAVAELERAMSLGLRGVQIATNVNGTYLGDDRFAPFWAAAADLGAVVEIHPVRGVGGSAKGSYYLWNAWANPAETALTASHMILAGVLENNPDLKVVLFHGGGHLPYQIGRLDRAYAMRPETRARISQPPSAYLKRCYFDTITHSAPALRFLIDLVGADRVMVGSDYPFDMGYERPAELVRGLGLPAADEARILGETAATLFW